MSNIGPALVAAYLLSEILEDVGVFDDSKNTTTTTNNNSFRRTIPTVDDKCPPGYIKQGNVCQWRGAFELHNFKLALQGDLSQLERLGWRVPVVLCLGLNENGVLGL